jgi:hypothetical protein
MVMALFLVFPPFLVSQSFGLQRIDELGGVQRIYEAGYAPRTYGEAFHVTEVSGPPTESPYETEEAPDVWRLYRSIRSSANYDSNIFSSRNDPRDDIVYVYEGNIGLSRSQKTYYVRLFYNAGYVQNIENEESNGYYHSQRTEFGYRFDRLSINANNTISPRTRIAVGERTDLGDRGTTISPVTDGAHVDLNYKFSPKTTAFFLYNYGLFYTPHEPPGEGSNSQTHEFGPRIRHALTPKTSIFAEYKWSVIQYIDDQSTKSWTETARAGISGRLNPKTSYGFDVAFPVRTYKSSEFGDIEGIALGWNLFRKVTPKLAGSIYGSWNNTLEDLDISRSSSLTRSSETHGVHLTWQATPHLSVFADASATFLWGEGFIMKEDPENGTLAFSRTPAEDIYRWGVGLNWAPKRYLSVFFGYDYLNHNESFSNDEFDRHRAVGSAEVVF